VTSLAPTRMTATSGATGSTATQGLPLEAGPLEPGTYTYDGFAESVTFTVGEGWEALLQGPDPGETVVGGFFALFHQDHPAANVAMLEVQRVVDPAKAWDESGNLVPVPDDLASWFAEHPAHDAGDVTAVTVAGRDASQVDLVVAEVPRNGWPPCGGRCVLWVPVYVDQSSGPLTTDDLVFGGADREHDRMIVIDEPTAPVLIDIGATNAKTFDRFAPLADSVIATLAIG